MTADIDDDVEYADFRLDLSEERIAAAKEHVARLEDAAQLDAKKYWDELEAVVAEALRPVGFAFASEEGDAAASDIASLIYVLMSRPPL
jgi:hypothetical protein